MLVSMYRVWWNRHRPSAAGTWAPFGLAPAETTEAPIVARWGRDGWGREGREWYDLVFGMAVWYGVGRGTSMVGKGGM